jgi:hypothetical protein
MAEVIHKIIVPLHGHGYLNELILCWKIQGAPSPDEIRHTKYAINFNDVTCDECRSIWINQWP